MDKRKTKSPPKPLSSSPRGRAGRVHQQWLQLSHPVTSATQEESLRDLHKHLYIHRQDDSCKTNMEKTRRPVRMKPSVHG
ncbi:hypothetical protein GDO81_017712 [Engystomops pustulosus]|uniref:Uncharacterized protein n=1 Tax=Engystomops pustulosus TaxID=76066 RepID=A0AAV7A8X8_ENGPU|nr:hypothetical protein GDO81_017712 [Engystomops pustulosus]